MPTKSLVRAIPDMDGADGMSPPERAQMLAALDFLSDNHQLGYNRLMRHLGQRTDLKTIFKLRKQIPAGFTESVALALGLPLHELYSIHSASPELLHKVLAQMIANDLVEHCKRKTSPYRRPQAVPVR